MKEITRETLVSSSERRIKIYSDHTIDAKNEFLEKNKEYGQTWLVYRPVSLLTRIWNKALRIRSIQEKKEQQIGDSIASEFKAIFNYCIIALIVTSRMKSDTSESVTALRLEPTHEDLEIPYDKALEQCMVLFKKKDHDYNGAWVEMRISTMVDEILMKLLRAISILEKNLETKDLQAKLAEILMDIANYAVFAKILIEDAEVSDLR